MTNIGFTGPRSGMTNQQEDACTLILFEYTVDNVHHGDCVGADKQFHDMVRGMYGADVHIVGHPGLDRFGRSPSRAYCEVDEAREPLPYIARNKIIVESVDVMIATPSEYHERRRSGTWTTIRIALHRKGGTLHVVYPDGSVRRY